MSPTGARHALRPAALLAVGAALLPTPAGSAGGTSAGQLYAFGGNYYGELGNATNNKTAEPNSTPALVTLPGATGPVRQVAAGEIHTLALTSTGQLYAFGFNKFGELGNATNNKTEEPNPTPALVSLPGASGPAVQIAAGAFHSLALTSTGQLYAFGENNFGQLGNATNNKTPEPNPGPTLVTLPGATGPVTQIAAGANDSFALTSTGQLYSFGNNEFGQLGNATNDKTGEPNPTPTVVTLPGATGPVTQVAAGGDHTLAVTSSGQLYAFGANPYGELGNATNDKTAEPNPTPTLVSLPGASGPVVQVAAGIYHSLALTSTDQLYAFGENYAGQLGNATNNKTTEPNPTPALVSLPGASGAIVRIAAGAYHSLALTSSGQLFAFGENSSGQLGNGAGTTLGEPHPTPLLVNLAGGASIDTMSRGPMADHTLVVVADLAVASSTLPAGRVGTPYSAQLQGIGGAQPYRWSASALPPGLSLDTGTGAISGTPSAAGSYTAAFKITDGDGIETSASLVIVIGAKAASARKALTGIAHAAHSASVKRGKASVKLTCTGQGPCKGTLKLLARVVQRTGKGHGKRHPRGRVRNIVIATASFSIAKGMSETLGAHLSAKGRALLAGAGKGGLHVAVAGSDVKAGTLVLKEARTGSGRGAKGKSAVRSVLAFGSTVFGSPFDG